MARIAAAAVFVGGASLAVAGMAAAEEPDPCALHPLSAKCLPVPLGLPDSSESPQAAASDTGNAAQERNAGNGNKDTQQPTDGSTPTVPGETQGQGSTPPASSPGSTATTPPTDQQTAPPDSGTPAGANTTGGTTGGSTGTPTSGNQCSIANGGVNCGGTKGSTSAGAIGDSGPQRNYGGGTTGGIAAADTPNATAESAAAGTTGTAGTPGATGAATDVQELAATGQSANLTFIVIGGIAMAGGGLAFTIVPRKLSRREATAAA